MCACRTVSLCVAACLPKLAMVPHRRRILPTAKVVAFLTCDQQTLRESVSGGRCVWGVYMGIHMRSHCWFALNKSGKGL